MFNSLGNFAELMRNAGKIKESLGQANETLGRVEVEGVADTSVGSVRVRANGRLEITAVEIAPALMTEVTAEALSELVSEAVNKALIRSREEAAKALTGGLSLPGFPSLGGGA